MNDTVWDRLTALKPWPDLVVLFALFDLGRNLGRLLYYLAIWMVT